LGNVSFIWFETLDKEIMNAVQSHYLDLIVRVIADTIYCDPNMNPRKDPIYQQGFREEGRDWPAQAHSMIGLKRLDNVKDLCSRAIEEGIEGDFIETGVWWGGACTLMRSIL